MSWNRLGASAARALTRIAQGREVGGHGGAKRPAAPRPVVIEAVKVADAVDAVDREVVARMSPRQEERYARTRGLALLGEGEQAQPAWDGCTGCYKLKARLDDEVRAGRLEFGHAATCPTCGARWVISTTQR